MPQARCTIKCIAWKYFALPIVVQLHLMVAMRFREGVAVLVVVFCSVVVRAAAQEGKRSYNVRNIYRNFTYRHAPSPCAIINWRVGNKGRRSLYVTACVYGVYTHAYLYLYISEVYHCYIIV